MDLIYIFTFDYSLSTWNSSGHISREALYFSELNSDNFDKITLITYGDDSDYEFLDDFKNIDIIPIYSFTRRPKLKVLRYLKSFYLPFLLKRLLVISNSAVIKQNQLQGCWVSIILKFITNCKIIIRTGYDYFTFSKYSKKNYLIRFLYYLLTQFALISSDIYTVTSSVDKNFLTKNFLTKKNIYVIPNWVKYSSFTKNENRVKNVILSIGRIEKQKNLFQLIDELEGSTYKILHIGSGSQKDSLVNYADQKNVELEIIDYLENSEIYNLLSKYKLYVSLSHYEGNSKTILEALGSGCIVFASDIMNNRELITNKENGILVDLSSNNLLSEIELVLDDLNLQKKIQINAIDKIKKINSLSRIIKLEDELIQNL